MKFPYIPISYVIADIRSEWKRLNQAGEINEEDCINYIIECIREIGGANYPEDAGIVHISNHLGKLPDNLYKIDQLWLCNQAIDSSQISKVGSMVIMDGDIAYYGTSMLFPGDSFTGSKYCLQYRQPGSLNEPTYIVRDKQIRCSISKCIIGIKYLSMIDNKDGKGYQMQDEINSIKAVKAFTKMMLLGEKWMMQEIPSYVYESIKRDYEIHLDQAQGIMKFDDPADDQAKGYKQDHRYDRFNLR